MTTTPEQLADLEKARRLANLVGGDVAHMLRTLSAQVEQLTRERDAAFAMSRCECGTDEACANLAKLHAELAQARAELEGLKAQGQWLPIESAPKTGTSVWAYAPGSRIDQGVMHWYDFCPVALWAWADDMLDDIDQVPVQPTHWRPLPPPPTGDESAAIDSARAGREG